MDQNAHFAYLFHHSKFFAFFAPIFCVYWLIPRQRLRALWLLGASCYFYMAWNPWLILLILFSASVDYFAALAMERKPGWRKPLLMGSIAMNLSLLAYFKYANFFLSNACQALAWFDIEANYRTLNIVLPLGISFYTFETISYIVDVYRGRVQAVRNPLDYALFIMFFPHLIAGPIVRPRDFLPQIQRPKVWDWSRGYLGVRMFLLGFFKKAILADNLATFVDPVFKDPGQYAGLDILFAVLAYAVQIYGDFSGYSDMGIGLAHMFGYKLGVNFNFPYFADSITDFWRRWHVSLSSWLRDYLYIPLGGSRVGPVRTYGNLILVMLLGGLWHGASWTFVAWGLFHGILLAIHRAIPWPEFTKSAVLRPLWTVGTFSFVCVGWVFFRAESFAGAATILSRIAAWSPGETLGSIPHAIVLMCLGCIIAEHGLLAQGRFLWRERKIPAPIMGAGLAGLIMASCVFLPNVTKAFIYFQF